MNLEWEGAELCYYYNDESHGFDLSNSQFAIIVKILGLKMNPDGSVSCFSDATLKHLLEINSNPLKLVEVERDR